MDKPGLAVNDCLLIGFQELNLDYPDENNYFSGFSSDSNLHPYPARAVPDMVNALITTICKHRRIKTVMDPFVGSGTVALEAKLLGLDFIGIDLNPLAILLARTKCATIPDSPLLIKKITAFIDTLRTYSLAGPFTVQSFPHIDYWFKYENIIQLSYLKYRISHFLIELRQHKEICALILLTAYSGTIRESSLSRNGEFKMYRLPKCEIERFKINSIEHFVRNVENILCMMQTINITCASDSKMQIVLGNAKDIHKITNKKVELILTSPPYGDSNSTVSYGQFSKLSLQWMKDLIHKHVKIPVAIDNCDDHLLGGGKSSPLFSWDLKNSYVQVSPTLLTLATQMADFIDAEINRIDKLQAQITNSQICDFDKDPNILFEQRLRFYYTKRAKKKWPELSVAEIRRVVEKRLSQFNNRSYLCQFRYKPVIDIVMKDVINTLNRRKIELPKRFREVMRFFEDLYKVVETTDIVMEKNGVQAWIVGHRTVLGRFRVNLAQILLEWFRALDYIEISCLTRQCHFKRLPYHINSTYTRQDKIQTMVEEYIIVVQKK